MDRQIREDLVSSVIDDALRAYMAGIQQERDLESTLLNIMGKYVAARLTITEKTAQLLLAARLAIAREGADDG
jgi:hypothetical protein